MENRDSIIWTWYFIYLFTNIYLLTSLYSQIAEKPSVDTVINTNSGTIRQKKVVIPIKLLL